MNMHASNNVRNEIQMQICMIPLSAQPKIDKNRDILVGEGRWSLVDFDWCLFLLLGLFWVSVMSNALQNVT